MQPTHEETLERVRRITAEFLGIDQNKITPATTLKDLDVETDNWYDLQLYLAKEFGFVATQGNMLKSDELADLTMNEIAILVQQKLSET